MKKKNSTQKLRVAEILLSATNFVVILLLQRDFEPDLIAQLCDSQNMALRGILHDNISTVFRILIEPRLPTLKCFILYTSHKGRDIFWRVLYFRAYTSGHNGRD